MKRFTLLAAAAFAILAATAQEAPVKARSVQETLSSEPVLRNPTNIPYGNKAMRTDFASSRIGQAPPTRMNRVNRIDNNDGIITEAPAGNKVMYTRNSEAYYLFYGEVYYTEVKNSVGEIVYADDNSVYIWEPFSMLSTRSYMKGTIDEEGVVTVNLPQPIFAEDYQGEHYVYNVDRMVYFEDEEGAWYEPDADNREVTFTLRDGVLTFDETDGDVIIGLTDEAGNWYGYGDYNTVYIPFEDKVVELPANVQAEDWVLIEGTDGTWVKVAFDGNDVYLGSLYEDVPDGWVKGTRNGDKVTFASPQYLGPDYSTGYHAYFMSVEIGEVWDEYWEEYIDGYIPIDQLEFTYDADNKTLQSDGILLINGGTEEINYIWAYEAPLIQYPALATGAVKPQTPAIVDFMEYDPAYGYGYIQFDLPKFDVDGHFLDINKMHYNLLVDDEKVFTLTTSDYVELAEDMTDIPYAFTDDWDIIADGSVTHSIYFYTAGFERMGVQTVYTAEDGKIAKSDIAWSTGEVTETAIDNRPATTAEVIRIAYFELTGRQLDAPAKGVCIQAITYTDGTVKNLKVMNR